MAAEKKNTALATVDTFQIVTGMEGLDEELLAELENGRPGRCERNLL